MLVCVLCLSALEVSLKWELPSRTWYRILSSANLKQHGKEMLSSWWAWLCTGVLAPARAQLISRSRSRALAQPGNTRLPEHRQVPLPGTPQCASCLSFNTCCCLGSVPLPFPWISRCWNDNYGHLEHMCPMCSPSHWANRWTVGDWLEERSQCYDQWPFPAPELTSLLPTRQGASRVGEGTTVSLYSPPRTAWAGSCLPLTSLDPCWA